MSTVRSHFRWHLADFPSKLQVVSFKEGVNGRGSFVRHKCIMKICNEIPFVVPDTVLEIAAQIFHVVELSSVFFVFFFSSTWLTWMGIKYLKLSSRLSKLYWTYWLNLQESKRVISQGLWLKKKKKKSKRQIHPLCYSRFFHKLSFGGEKHFWATVHQVTMSLHSLATTQVGFKACSAPLAARLTELMAATVSSSYSGVMLPPVYVSTMILQVTNSFIFHL